MATRPGRLVAFALAALVAALGLLAGPFGPRSGAQGPPAQPGGPASPGRTVRTVVTFDLVDGVPGVPEGITSDGDGGFYVSLFLLDQVWHVEPRLGTRTKVADVPGGGLQGDLVGIERDSTDGTILAAFKKGGADLFTPDHPDCRDATDTITGVYRLDPATGRVTPFVTRGGGTPFCFPDDLAVDGAGNVYVSDLELGLIWKFDRQGRGGVWSDDPLLGWTSAGDLSWT